MRNEDIVVTSLSVITPIGTHPGDFWTNLCAGRNRFGPPTSFDPAKHSLTVKVSSEMPEFDFGTYKDRLKSFTPSPARLDRAILLGLAAGGLALEGSRLGANKNTSRRPRIGLAIGSGLGGGQSFEAGLASYTEKGRNKGLSWTVLNVMLNGTAGFGAIGYALGGPSYAIANACASASFAISAAADDIRLGRADAMLAIGTESVVTGFQEACFNTMEAMSERSVSLPFELGRDGLIMGEGAGAMVLIRESEAKRLGLPILARLLGAWKNTDAYKMAQPSVDAIEECMESAVGDAGLSITDIDYINAHATATAVGDVREALAIWRLFGDPSHPFPDRLRIPLVSGTKSALGHTLGAAGILGAVATILSMNNGQIPGMGSYSLDPECVRPWTSKDAKGMKIRPDPYDRVIPFVMETTKADIRYAISNAFGFGGHNCVLVWGRP